MPRKSKAFGRGDAIRRIVSEKLACERERHTQSGFEEDTGCVEKSVK